MKPNRVSSIPLTFLHLGAALMLFFILGMFVNEVPSNRWLRELERNPFHNAIGELSPDGTLTYRAFRRDDKGFGMGWEFDDELRHKRKADPQSGTATLVPIRPEDSAAWARRVELLPGRSPSDSDFVWAWWNGPSGRIDFFDKPSRLRTGSIGAGGVVVPAPARSEGRISMAMPHLGFATAEAGAAFATDSGIYLIDVGRREVTTLYEGKCIAFGTDVIRHPEWPARVLHVIATPEGTLLLRNLDGDTLRRVKLPEKALEIVKREGTSVRFFENGRMMVGGSQYGPRQKTSVFLITDAGEIIRRVDYDPEAIERAMNEGTEPENRIVCPTPFFPLPGMMTSAALAQSGIVSLILAAIVLWRQTRAGRRGAKRTAWVVFTFLFGLLGAATYWASQREHVTEPCPDCGGRRRVDEAVCSHCHQAWPTPKALGIEIIEPA